MVFGSTVTFIRDRRVVVSRTLEMFSDVVSCYVLSKCGYLCSLLIEVFCRFYTIVPSVSWVFAHFGEVL